MRQMRQRLYSLIIWPRGTQVARTLFYKMDGIFKPRVAQLATWKDINRKVGDLRPFKMRASEAPKAL